ncbi:MAG: HlyD family type I secretion periplasmic adaptor subunit [Alsobacter sp.]
MSKASTPALPRPASDNWKAPIAAAWLSILVFFGFGGVWAAVARLDQAAVAPGVVTPAMNRKTLQHYEGGIVREILVRDGDHVEEGQVLVRLEPTLAQASASSVRSQLAVAVAQEARLVAERDESPVLIFPEEVTSQASDPAVGRAMADQETQFRDRRANLTGQFSILQSRLRQLTEEQNGLVRLRDSSIEQVDKINSELVGLRELAEKKLIPITRVYSMEREKARLDGDIGKAEADIARNGQVAGETNLQIEQLKKQFAEGVSKDLVDTRKIISDLRERQTVATDVLRRVEVKAPLKGVVQGMKIFTVGGVLKPGDPIMDIAPDTDELVIRAQVSPNDIDSVKVGDTAEISFAAFASRKPPIFYGKVRALSRDRLIDETDKKPYFAAEVVADGTSIPPYFRDRITAGMQADAIITTGERTALQYFTSPLVERLRRSMREY